MVAPYPSTHRSRKIPRISPKIGVFGVVEYYGYRYYHTNLGRWLSRDPLGEKGGLNLYAFVRNNGLNNSDFIGLSCYEKPDSFEWDVPLEIANIKINLKTQSMPNSVTGSYVAEFKSADITWKGHAQVTCCCEKIGDVDAGGDITGKSSVGLGQQFMFGVLSNIVTPANSVKVGDLISLAVSWASESLPSEIIDPASTWPLLMSEIKAAATADDASIEWDNNKFNPCQALVDK
jgi:uncharacterized protein RhaS with RHS repeats